MNKREFFKKRDDNKSPNNERGKRENSSYSKKQTFKKFTGPKPSFRSSESNKPSGNNNRFSKKRDDNKSPNNERGKREASSYNKNPNNLRDFKKPYKFKNNNNNRGSNFKARPFRKNISSKLRLDLECKICKSKIRDVLFALSKDNESAFHFDCILNQIREEHKLTKKQDVVYKGSGKFFIIDRSDRSPNLFFKVIKEVEFENLQELPVWRKKIVEQLNKDFNFY